MNKKTVLIFCSVLGVLGGVSSNSSSSSAAEPIVTDRPDFTESAETVPRGQIQIETGILFSRSGKGAEREKERAMDETLIRIATGDRSELRIEVPSYIRVRTSGEHGTKSGFDDGYLGGKWVLRRGEAGKAGVALLAGTTLPTGSRSIAERKAQPEAIFAVETELTEKLSFGVNAGVARAVAEGKRFGQFFGSVALDYELSKKWGTYTELYAYNRTEHDGGAQKYFNGGFTYLVNDDLQLDTRIGYGLGNGNGRERHWGVGVSHRF